MGAARAQNIFADAGVEWKWYRYYDAGTVGLDFEGLMEDLRGAPEGSVVVLHGARLIWHSIMDSVTSLFLVFFVRALAEHS
jgi:hypothetical protein